jgi:hypothetical protein
MGTVEDIFFSTLLLALSVPLLPAFISRRPAFSLPSIPPTQLRSRIESKFGGRMRRRRVRPPALDEIKLLLVVLTDRQSLVDVARDLVAVSRRLEKKLPIPLSLACRREGSTSARFSLTSSRRTRGAIDGREWTESQSRPKSALQRTGLQRVRRTTGVRA